MTSGNAPWTESTSPTWDSTDSHRLYARSSRKSWARTPREGKAPPPLRPQTSTEAERHPTLRLYTLLSAHPSRPLPCPCPLKKVPAATTTSPSATHRRLRRGRNILYKGEWAPTGTGETHGKRANYYPGRSLPCGRAKAHPAAIGIAGVFSILDSRQRITRSVIAAA